MPRSRKATKACQTDYELFERRIAALEEDFSKLQKENTDLKSTNAKLIKEFEAIKQLQEKESANTKKQSNSDIEQIMMPHLHKIQTETEQIKSSSEKIKDDLDSLNNLQQAAEISVEQLEARYETTEEEIEKKIDGISEQIESKHKFQEMHQKIDDLEQQSRLKYLRVFGLEESGDEDVTATVVNFAREEMKILIDPNEIEARRMGIAQPMNSKPRDILVKFINQPLRNIMYQKKRMLCQKTQQVFINEYLTTRRSELFFQVRQLKKQHKLFGAWTQSGNILIKINQDSTPKAISNIEDVKSLIGNKPCSDTDTDIETFSFDDAI